MLRIMAIAGISASEFGRERDATRRKEAMEETKEELEKLKETSSKGAYYSHVKLYKKVAEILESHHVKNLWDIRITPLKEGIPPDQKTRLDLQFSPREEEIARQ